MYIEYSELLALRIELHAEIVKYQLKLGVYNDPVWAGEEFRHLSIHAKMLLNQAGFDNLTVLTSVTDKYLPPLTDTLKDYVRTQTLQQEHVKITSINGFNHPLSTFDMATVIGLLTQNQFVIIGSVSLHPDKELNCIWGMDDYGNEVLVATSLNDVEKAINWACNQDTNSVFVEYY